MASISSYSSSLFSTILLLSFFLNAFAQGTPPTTEPIQKDRVSLVLPVINSFKEKIVDRNAKTRTWIGNDVCKNYIGFECETIPGLHLRVLAAVKFDGFSLNGRGGQLSLQGFLDKFPDIYYFSANSNNFTGTIPKIDSDHILPYLSYLDVSNNKLSGPFPPAISGAKFLKFLDLRFNNFYGAIPQELFDLGLEIILLNNNNFGQQLPSNIGSTSASTFSVANNKITGPIPQSIGQATNLVELVFLNNQLTGCLPPGIGLLKNLALFDASGNNLTGPIPNSFSQFKKIETLNLRSNSLFGTIPEALCQIKNLNLTVSNNYFTRVGPECRKLILNGVLNIDKNCVSGLPNQKSKAECDKFLSLPKKCPDVNLRNSKVMTVNLNKTNGQFNKLIGGKGNPNAMILNSKVVKLNHQRGVGSVATRFTTYGALDAHKSV